LKEEGFLMHIDEHRLKIETENQKIKNNMLKIKKHIMVFSGKGGVGKTTVSINLAYTLYHKKLQTAILDADITGPNVPKMLAVDKMLSIEKDRIIPLEVNGIKIVSIANLIESGQPVIWRGPMRSKVLNQFLADVEWGELDFLVIDLPPGTGDEIITMVQKIQPELALIVTTPQDVSLLDAKKAINMARKMNIPAIGLIENMSGLICPDCGKRIDIFGTGGGKKLAKEMNIQFLGELPLDINLRKISDSGEVIVVKDKKSKTTLAMMEIVEKILHMK
jgi:ATP-binding protein involved in chromosome partitioning